MQGGDLKTLQYLMGHKSIITTSKYVHFVQGHLAKEIKRIDNLFGEQHADDANGTDGQ
jgi:site-specific recombinase XerD